MATVLITGTNRGLGLEFVKQYAQEGWQVIACCRHPESAEALQQLALTYPGIRLKSLDVADFKQIEALSAELSNQPVDVLINNAGISGDELGDGFGHLDYATWIDNFIVNCQAPIKMAEVFLPNLKQGGQKLIVNISSLMGSITDNTGGGSIIYRSSKSALNSAMKSLAIELKDQGIGVLLFHPGWVKTDMGGPNALINPDSSISGMRKVIAEFSLAQTGSFIKYDGVSLPW